MIIKEFRAKTEAEAIAMAKSELGDNVFIMSTRKEKPKGLFSIFKSVVYVCTATIEPESSATQNKGIDANSIQEAVSSIDRLRLLSENNDSEDKRLSPELESKLDNITSLIEEKFKISDDNYVEDDNDTVIVRNSSIDNKADTSENHEIPSDEIMDFIKLLYNSMVDNEVSEQYANQMVEEIQQNYNRNMEMEYILSHIYQKMILKFGKAEVITSSGHKGPKYIFFIGPTGVGKTTTLAKIASLLSVFERKKIALVAADTYRVAATDQLKTYADIMETPFEIVYTPEELKNTISKYADFDYVLVDTTGHSHKNEEQLTKIKEFVNVIGDNVSKETYLVLSATTKYRDLLKIADAYSVIDDFKLIFTKLDETQYYGNLLNIHIYTGAPMSYITCGQNVPDDIEKFDAQEIVRKLLVCNS